MRTEFLHSFLLTIKSGSVAEAARQAGVTSTAISQQLHSLEQTLGVTLMKRSGRTLKPTPAGNRLIEQARLILREYDTLLLKAHAEETTEELRIGSIRMVLHGVLPVALTRFAPLYPGLKLQLESGSTLPLYNELTCGKHDLIFCIKPPFALPKTAHWQRLYEDHLVLLVPPSLARFGVHTLLTRHPFIRYSATKGGGRLAEEYLKHHNLEVDERFELSSLLGIALLVEQGLGVALVPDTPQSQFSGMHIERLPLPDSSSPREAGAIWLRDSRKKTVIRSLVDTVTHITG